MSWSLHTIPVPGEGKTIRESVEAHRLASGAVVDSPEEEEQVTAATGVLEDLINSGALGEGPFFADLSGHANPDHKPRPGYVSDTVTVSVRQERA